MRALLLSIALLLLGACTNPILVDCDPGRFVRAGGDAWCLFPRGVAVGCPDDLPVDHDLPWGGRGCASVEHAPLPDDLCTVDPACSRDAG